MGPKISIVVDAAQLADWEQPAALDGFDAPTEVVTSVTESTGDLVCVVGRLPTAAVPALRNLCARVEQTPGLGAAGLDLSRAGGDARPVSMLAADGFVTHGPLARGRLHEPSLLAAEFSVADLCRALVAYGYTLEAHPAPDGVTVPAAPQAGPPPPVEGKGVVRRLAPLLGHRRLLLRVLARRTRRLAFLVRVRAAAWARNCPLSLEVHRSADIARDVRVDFHPGRECRLSIGPRTLIEPGCIIRLGGELVLGRNGHLRYGVVLNVKGRLRLSGRNVLGRGTMVHADADMLWEWGACTSEFVSVLDSDHDFDGSLVHLHDQPVRSWPMTVGASSLIGAHATVLAGSLIGRGCLVGAGSVLRGTVPDGMVAVGSPAKPRRSLRDQREAETSDR